MSIEGINTREPVLFLKPVKGFNPDAARSVRERLLSFEFEYGLKRLDLARIELDNTDGALLSMESMALGVELDVSWGYVDLQTAPRRLVVKRIKGLAGQRTTHGGRRPVRESLGGSGKVYLECWSKLQRLHRLQPDDNFGRVQPSPRTFYNVRLSTVITEIAAYYGYTPSGPLGRRLVLEPPEDDPVLETVVIPSGWTDAQWLRDQANRLRYVFNLDAQAFRFHSRRYDPGPLIELSFFSGTPDVLNYEIDGDLRFGAPRRTSARGVDLIGLRIQRLSSGPNDEGPLNTPEAPSEAEVDEVGTPIQPGGASGGALSGFLSVDVSGARSLVDILPVPRVRERGRASASGRLRANAEKKWKLKLELVGNPLIRSRQFIRCNNFGFLIDGDWYTRKVIHSYSASKVYLTQVVEATREQPGQRKGKVAKKTFLRTSDAQGNLTGGLSVEGEFSDGPPRSTESEE